MVMLLQRHLNGQHTHHLQVNNISILKMKSTTTSPSFDKLVITT
jgi:hypothetical protein